MTDVELVRGAREEDAEAWKTLYQRYMPAAWRYAYTLVGDVHLAEDIVGETMLALLKGIHSIDAEAPKISAWLRSVVRHKVADHHRQSCRSEERMKRALKRKEAIALPDTSPDAPMVVAETRSQVLGVLDRLSDRQRIALEWKYLEDLPVREIAERLGETEKVVEATLYRARREFRRLFGSIETRVPGVPHRILPGKQVEFDAPSK